jgi:hypothetical protein
VPCTEGLSCLSSAPFSLHLPWLPQMSHLAIIIDERSSMCLKRLAPVASLSHDHHLPARPARLKPPSTLQAWPPHKAFCTRGTYVRYLRARGWNVKKAAKMLEETLTW